MSLSYRSHYLGQLGIHQWYARKRLLGAGPSPDCLFEPEVLNLARPNVDSKTASQGLVSAELSAGTVSEMFAASGIVGAPEPGRDPERVVNDAAKVLLREVAGGDDQEGGAGVPAATSIVAQNERVSSGQNFSFRAYLVDRYLVTTSIGRDQPDAPERRLAENIVKACTKDNSSLERAAVFEWPVFSRSGLHAHFALSGEECLARWLSDLCAGEPEVHLHFGMQAEAIKLDEAGGIKQVAFDFTISDMLSNTLLKADCWQRLLAEGVVAEKRGER